MIKDTEKVDVEYEVGDGEFDMSDVDESVMSFRGGNSGEDSIANKTGVGSSKNKYLTILQNISSENIAGGQNNSNSFNKGDSMINQPSVFP